MHASTHLSNAAFPNFFTVINFTYLYKQLSLIYWEKFNTYGTDNYQIPAGKISDVFILIISAKHFSEDVASADNTNNFASFYDWYTAEMFS